MKIKLEKIFTNNDKIVIIGGGPSLRNININILRQNKKIRVIGVNAAYKLGNFVEICFTGDCRFIEWNLKELVNWSNQFITCCLLYKNHKKIQFIEQKQTRHIEPDNMTSVPWPIQKGANSGASAICLAIKLGAKNIYLLGYDGKPENGKHHWHNYHKTPTRDNVYKHFMPFFKQIADDSKKLNINIYNVNTNSNIPYFKKISFQNFIDIII